MARFERAALGFLKQEGAANWRHGLDFLGVVE